MDNNYILVELDDDFVLLTYGRIKISDTEGLYKYDIQSSDDGFSAEILQRSALINHWGSILSKEPLLSDQEKFKYIKSLKYLDSDPLSIKEYKSLDDKEILKLESEDLSHDLY